MPASQRSTFLGVDDDEFDLGALLDSLWLDRKLVALIAAVIIGAVTLLGTNLSSKFNAVATTVGSAGS